MSTYRIQASSVEAPQFSGSFLGDGSGLTGIGGATPTGSLLTTASFTSPNLIFTKGDSTTFNVNVSSLTSSLVQSSQTSSMSVLSSSFAATASFVPLAQTASYILNAVSSSFATTASFASNGGVTQILS